MCVISADDLLFVWNLGRLRVEAASGHADGGTRRFRLR